MKDNMTFWQRLVYLFSGKTDSTDEEKEVEKELEEIVDEKVDDVFPESPSDEQIAEYLKRKEEKEKEEKEAKLQSIKDNREELVKFYENSDEPWIQIFSSDFDNEKQEIAVDVEWNEAFVKYLELNGFSGSDKEKLVYSYLASMYTSKLTEDTNLNQEDANKEMAKDYN